jgi:DNA ligase (NAD+)
MDSIERAKQRPLFQLMTSLGIDGVGSTVANLLVSHFDSLDSLADVATRTRAAELSFRQLVEPLVQSVRGNLLGQNGEVIRSIERLDDPLTELAPRYLDGKDVEGRLKRLLKPLYETVEADDDAVATALKNLIDAAAPLLRIEGFGPVLVDNVIGWFADEHNQRVVAKMKTAGVNMQGEKKVAASDALQGKTFVLTGTLPTMSREEASALIESHGGKVSGSVSSKTHFVLVGESPGSKADKARQLGVPIISEADLKIMVGAND